MAWVPIYHTVDVVDGQFDANKFIKTGGLSLWVAGGRHPAFDLPGDGQAGRLVSDRKRRVVRACAVTIADDER